MPYWLPLALFCGIVSQFVPTVGTYIGGALPVLFAWGSNGLWYGVGVLVFIIVYQQIENLILSPKVSQRTMDLNPCVAFLAVLVMGALFGALGAFLALPVTASMPGHLQGVHEALCAGGVAADERSGAGEEVQGRGGRRGVQ